MQCPYCNTENREDRERCYACDRDLSMLRLIVNKARHHYNQALEHAERGRFNEAIDELHNAIDLDRRFTNAHVVLGTIHAKQNNFEKAREAWQAALAVEPELLKAHSYLQKSDQVEETLPTVRNLQIVSGLLLLLAMVLSALLIMVRQVDDESVVLLKSAQTAYESGKYATALAELDRAVKSESRTDAVPTAARSLAAAIKSELAQRVRLTQELQYAERYDEALAATVDIEALEPDAETSAAVAVIRDAVTRYFREQVQEMLAQVAAGQMSYSELTQRITGYLEIYPEVPEKEEIRQYLNDAREMEVQSRGAQIRDEFKASGDVDKALTEMRELAAQFPGLDAVAEARGVLVEDVLSKTFDDFQGQLDASDFAGAGDTLYRIEQLAGSFADLVDVSGPISLSRRLLADAIQARRLKEAEELAKTGDPRAAEDAVVSILVEERLTTGELELMDLLIATLERRELEQQAKAFLAGYDEFMTLKMTTATAVALLDSLDRTLALAGTLNQRERNRLVACAAASAIKLARLDEAERLIVKLEEDNGDRRAATALRRLLRPRTR